MPPAGVPLSIEALRESARENFNRREQEFVDHLMPILLESSKKGKTYAFVTFIFNAQLQDHLNKAFEIVFSRHKSDGFPFFPVDLDVKEVVALLKRHGFDAAANPRVKDPCKGSPPWFYSHFLWGKYEPYGPPVQCMNSSVVFPPFSRDRFRKDHHPDYDSLVRKLRNTPPDIYVSWAPAVMQIDAAGDALAPGAKPPAPAVMQIDSDWDVVNPFGSS